MINLKTKNAVYWNVHLSVRMAVDGAVNWDVEDKVHNATKSMDWVVYWAVDGALRKGSQHPSLQVFLRDVKRPR